MNQSIKKIISCYQSDNQKTIDNLEKIFETGSLRGTGKIVISAIDQGFEHGPAKSFHSNPEAYDPEYHFALAVKSGCSALTAPLGFLEIGAKKYAHQIPLILKLNNNHSFYQVEKNNTIAALTATVSDALRLGCLGVGFTIYPGSIFSNQFYQQAQKVIKEAKENGLVTVIWAYPRGENIPVSQQDAINVVAYAVQIACQLGAHLIKTKIPLNCIVKGIDSEAYRDEVVLRSSLKSRIEQVMRAAFNGRRIVLFSGGPSKNDLELYQEIEAIKEGGGFGSVIGRNIFQRPEPETIKLLNKIMAIYKRA